jgi:AcrR family transcriptional regulator
MGEERKSSRTGRVTRDRIIDAALRTVREEGLVRTSVRQIARTGGFNQALVFYHFGSVEELLLASLERADERRVEQFGERLRSVDSLAGLVRVGTELHASDNDGVCNHSALSAIVAGWSANSEHAPRILEILEPWDELVAGALRRSLADTPFGSLVPTDQLAHAISALFLGIELLNRLEGDSRRTDELLASLVGAAELAGPMLQALGARPVAD